MLFTYFKSSEHITMQSFLPAYTPLTYNIPFSCKISSNTIIWAEIFNNVISNSSWLTNKSFSAGRWAVGYQYLYVVYRILNEVRPKNILELGLGQSTRLFGQYAASDVEVQHIVVEHDHLLQL